MDDLLYIGVTIVAFGLLWAFTWACEGLRKVK